jgi:predicted glutamine amidotransferase
MCRWIGYIGAPVLMEELILKPEHSLIDQSLASKEGAETTNGDGFGVGWYGDQPVPGVYKSIEPAWNDRNLAALSKHIRSHLFLAHVRATTGTPVQQTNCHPFCNGEWLFVHNGLVRSYAQRKRDLVLQVAPALFYGIEGTTDSELMFNLAITFGLKDEPLTALERMTGLVEEIGHRHGVEYPIQMTLGLSDGKRLYAVRYSSEHQSRSLYHSASIDALAEIHPALQRFSRDARAVVSEPLSDMSEAWVRVPESSAVVIESGEVNVLPFAPRSPV